MNASSEASRAAYRDILQLARRFVFSAEDARDLAQDALLIALDRGFDDWSSSARRPWLSGVLRKRAAFIARSDQRRRQRELVPGHPTLFRGARWSWQPRFLDSLPPSLRVLASLASADLCATEIRWLLELSDAALRKRLSELRRAVRAAPELPTRPSPEPLISLGMRRGPLLTALKRLRGRVIATHDPDGHPILLGNLPHKIARAATRGQKESPCPNQ